MHGKCPELGKDEMPFQQAFFPSHNQCQNISCFVYNLSDCVSLKLRNFSKFTFEQDFPIP